MSLAKRMTLIETLLGAPIALMENENCLYLSEKLIFANTVPVLKALQQTAEQINIKWVRYAHLQLYYVNYAPQSLLCVFVSATTSPPKNQFKQLTTKITIAVQLLKNQSALPLIRTTLTFPGEKPLLQKAMPIHSQHNFSTNFQMERLLFLQLKKGNFSTIERLLDKLITINRSPLSDNQLRSQKYRITAFLTLLTRFIIEQSVPPNQAYQLSDRLIRQVDTIMHAHEFAALKGTIIQAYSQLLHERALHFASPLINQTVAYIQENLYADLSLTKIAEALVVNPTYLSTLFKQQTGTALHHFIVTTRLNEAKLLLKTTSLPLDDIADQLHFSSQSHFGQLFKSQTGTTPKKYRDAALPFN